MMTHVQTKLSKVARGLCDCGTTRNRLCPFTFDAMDYRSLTPFIHV